MDVPKIELRDDINMRDIGLFIALLVFLAFWLWLTFGSGWLF